MGLGPIGPTGKFPRGMVHDDDEGELKIAVTVDRNTLIIAFGKEVGWIGLDRNAAIDLAKTIRARAKDLT